MIRRDVRLADGSPAWMLISQIEHARVSGDLAVACTGRFNSASMTPTQICDEVHAAIRGHDDGWKAWEQSPRIDPQHGRPLSFTELAPQEATTIWSASIVAAEKFGPLAAWLVAGHFLRLASNSDAAQGDDRVGLWRAETESRRSAWIAAWKSQDPERHLQAVADDALQWLRAFDEASLWLCCTCSPGEGSIPCAPQPYCAGRGTPIEMTLSVTGDQAAVAEPWRFDAESIDVDAWGQVVPARRYRSADEMLAVASRRRLHWRLQPDRY